MRLEKGIEEAHLLINKPLSNILHYEDEVHLRKKIPRKKASKPWYKRKGVRFVFLKNQKMNMIKEEERSNYHDSSKNIVAFNNPLVR